MHRPYLNLFHLKLHSNIPGMLCLIFSTLVSAASDNISATGKSLSFQRSKGNCLACHSIADGDSPGNIGPPLTAIPSRFKNKAQLRAQIWDAGKFNPQTVMPPFGKNKILTEQEIDKITDYISLK